MVTRLFTSFLVIVQHQQALCLENQTGYLYPEW
jgi:hypothetical protein